MNPIVNSNVAPIYFKSLEKFIYLAERHTGQAIANPYFNRTLRRPISLHKQQIDPRNTFAEAVDLRHRHSEVEYLIL